MKRVIVSGQPDFSAGQEIEISADEWHHLLRVFRVKDGEEVEIIGDHQIARARVLVTGKQSGQLMSEGALTDDRESCLSMSVIMAYPVHRQTFTDLVPALVQLGVSHVSLVSSIYSGKISHAQKIQKRFTSIADQARKQCGRLRAPKFEIQPDWTKALQQAAAHEVKLIFHPTGETAGDRPDPQLKIDSVAMAVGPEAGFSDAEVMQAQEHGFQVCSLGPRILRTETAVVGACFWAQRCFGDSG